MRTRLALLAAVAVVGVGSISAEAQESLLSPGDFIIAIDTDAPGAVSSHPAGEAPGFALDQLATTKYLNFGEEGSGLIFTPGSSIVRSLNFTTANDAPARDPSSFQLFGTNSAIMSANNSTGMGETWTEITSGPISMALPDTRGSSLEEVIKRAKEINPEVFTHRVLADALGMTAGNVTHILKKRGGSVHE